MFIVDEHYRLPESVPTALVFLMAAAPVAAWILWHVIRRRGTLRLPRIAWMAGGTGIGFLAMLACGQLLMRWLILATNWAIWPIALAGAVSVEVVLFLYGLERRTVSRGTSLALGAMRVALVVLVILILAQPVRPWESDRSQERFVAVLVDESASMRIHDSEMSPAGRVRLAEMLGVRGVARPHELEAAAGTIAEAHARLQPVAEWLEGLRAAEASMARPRAGPRASGEADLDRGRPAAARSRVDRVAERRETVSEIFEEIQKSFAPVPVRLEAPLKGPVKLEKETVSDLALASRRFQKQVEEPLAILARTFEKKSDAELAKGHVGLQKDLEKALSAMADLLPQIQDLADAVDTAYHDTLPKGVQTRLSEAARRTRLALARDVLLGVETESDDARPDRAPKPLLKRLEDRYTAVVYTFARTPAELDIEAWRETGRVVKETAAPAPEGASPPANTPKVSSPDADDAAPGGEPEEPLAADKGLTDLAAALEKVMKDMAGRDLAGVVLLTDGRHNAAAEVEPLVRQLGLQGARVSSVAFGSTKPPRDASIVSVDAPETVFAEDRMYVRANVKLDALAGQEVTVTLYDGSEAVDQRTVRVPTDSYRTEVQLSDQPDATGLHKYRVELQQFDGEAFAANNRHPLTVNVTDDRVKLLIVEARPRWEFRYLKNLFADRDESVQLQYVLLRPDRIAGVPGRREVHASVVRERRDVEATALPESEEEWLKFDVIVLGDLPPSALTDTDFEALDTFVKERGGTLIVIAGPMYMPHAHERQGFAEILPVLYEPSGKALMTGPEKAFRLALTAEGRESVIMRQKTDPQENREVWDSVPEIYWRHPVRGAKEGATVLAYALPDAPPEFLRRDPEGPAPDAGAGQERHDRVRRFERENALLLTHRVGAGQVMFLAFDRTWRLRYRRGDTYHHRFWGQVLRWASGDKLPVGTDYVRIGTDRLRYSPEDTVRARAKLLDEDFAPIVSDRVAVKVMGGRDGDRLVLRRSLQYVEGSGGRYEADLGTLPSGAYQLVLDAPPAEAVLAKDNVDMLVAEFSVDPVSGVELAELTPNLGLLGRLATLTGGTVVGPQQAGQVLATLGRGTIVEIERHEFVIWDSWPILVLMVLVATAEWVLRKKVGLA